MPDRDFYLNPSQKMADIRTQYQAHIARMLELAQLPQAAARARAHLGPRAAHRAGALEPRRTPSRSSRATTTGRSPSSRSARPGLDWNAYFAAAGLGQQTEFVVWQPSAVTGIAALTGERAARDLEGLAALSPARARSRPTCRRPSATEHFEFHGRVLSGTPAAARRAGSAPSTKTNDALGEAVGKLYVARYFPPSEKARAEALVKNLHRRLRRTHRSPRVDGAADTRARQGQARRRSRSESGYPDHWRSFAGLEIERRRCLRQRRARRALRARAQPEEARTTRRPFRVGHGAPGGQRREPARNERAQLPGRHPAAAVLRSCSTAGHGLRRHRRNHRPRDQPQFR